MPEFRRLDLNSEDLGVGVARLMGNAGAALARAVRARLPPGGSVLLLCGKGNNGGDGFAAAVHLLKWGVDVEVVVVPRRGAVGPGAPRSFLRALPEDRVHDWPERAPPRWRDAAVAVDCLLGSGLAGAPRPPYDQAVRWLRRYRRGGGTVVACDVPSGMGTPLHAAADATVTFHAPKEGMDASCGDVEVAPIGIPRAAAEEVGLGDLDAGYVRPGTDSHKGDNGIVHIVGGGPFTGAVHYAGMAAYRAGADLVRLWTPGEAARAVACWGPELMVHTSNEGDRLDREGAAAAARRLGEAGALLLGPGLGTGSGTRDAAAWLLEQAADAGVPVVVDADGLDAVTPALLARHGPRLVLTPHAREFQDLSGWRPTDANVIRYARTHGVTVLRKGAVDLIAAPHRTKRCRRGHATMTVGGTGDVLAGVTAALLAKGAEPFDAACAAAYLTGCAGELAAQVLSYGATATDILEAVPAVLLRLP